MTRKEFTGTRDLTFSGWVREKLPDSSTGFMASDLDFILWNYKTRRIMLLEIKTRLSKPREWQRIMWSNMNKWIQKGIDDDWTYLGFHLVTFENSDFSDGKCFYDYKEITEDELIKTLSL